MKGFIGPVIVLALLSGCAASMSGYPPRAIPTNIEVEALIPYLMSDAAVKCRDVECRNQFIDASVRAIDLNYGDWKASLWQENTSLNLWSTIGTMVLSGAASMVGGPAAGYMAGGVAALAGGTAAFRSTVLGDKGALPLIMSMDSYRENVVVNLIECEMSTIENCGMLIAMHLVEDLYQTGSIPGGLSDIVTQATVVKAQARARTRAVRGLRP